LDPLLPHRHTIMSLFPYTTLFRSVAKVSQVTVTRKDDEYIVKGPLFFASTTKFMQFFDQIHEDKIIINFEKSHIWDESAVDAILKVKQKLEQKDMHVEIQGLNSASERLYEQLT